MELLILIAIIVFVVVLVVKAINSNVSPTMAAPTSSAPPQHRLSLLCTPGTTIIEQTEFDTLEVATVGIFSNTKHIVCPRFTVSMFDTGAGNSSESGPVLCLLEDLQAADSAEFRFVLNLEQELNAGSGSSEPVRFLRIPIDFLLFPYSGTRKVRITLVVEDLATRQKILECHCSWTTVVTGEGYIQQENKETSGLAESMKLAMCVAASDGSFGEDEVKAITTWGSKWVNSLPAGRQDRRRNFLNSALRQATEKIREGSLETLKTTCLSELKRLDNDSLLFEAFETCLHIVKADGELHPEEAAHLDEIANHLGLDQGTVKLLRDRHLLHLKVEPIMSEGSADKMLGIHSGMPKEEIRKKLNAVFRKYQGLQNHDKPETRQKAAEWLEMVASARLRHLS
jgi:tellurite resistance protein